MPHILVVDDDVMVRSIVTRILAVHDYKVSAAGNGREALDLLDRERPDLILSDIQMPEIDGWALYQEVQLRGLQIPFVGMSGNVTLGGEFDAFISKPFQMQDLLAAVRNALVAQPAS